MRKLITIIAILFVGSTYGQTAMSRTIEVKDGQMSKFIEMAGKKTKMYKLKNKNKWKNFNHFVL